MSRLDDFLGLNDVSELRETVELEFNGKKFQFVIRPLSDSEHNEYQKRCNNISKNKVMFDSGKYNKLLLDNCIVEPNFNDDAFLTKVGCSCGSEFLEKKFPAGILMELGVRIQKLSGFESYEMEIDNAKN